MGIDERTSRRAFMASASAAAAVPLIGGAAPASAGGHGTPPGPGRPIHPQRPSRALRALLDDIDRRRIEATVRRLVAFGTRHTLSSQDDPVRGIGAARDWIFEQLSGYAAASGGRMTVETQSYTQEPGPRVP